MSCVDKPCPLCPWLKRNNLRFKGYVLAFGKENGGTRLNHISCHDTLIEGTQTKTSEGVYTHKCLGRQMFLKENKIKDVTPASILKLPIIPVKADSIISTVQMMQEAQILYNKENGDS